MMREEIGQDTQSDVGPNSSLPGVIHRADIHHMLEAAEGSLDQVQVPVAGGYLGCR